MGSADIPFDNTLFKNRIESVAEQNRKYKFKWKRKKNKLLSRLDFLLLQTKKKREKERYCIWIKTNYILLIYFSDIKTKMKKIRLALSSPLDRGSQKNPKPKKLNKKQMWNIFQFIEKVLWTCNISIIHSHHLDSTIGLKTKILLFLSC